MEDILSIIFFVIFFFGGFIIKLVKGYMEDLEREKSHRDIARRNAERNFKTPPAARKSADADVFKRASASDFSRRAPKIPQPVRKSDGFEGSPFSGYEDRLRAIEAENAARLKNPVLSGEICGDCYVCHEGGNKIAELFKERENLANAVVMSEILSKPLSLRSSRDLF